MSDSFDPYYHWLAIPPDEQPPNYYRLLALRLYEDNPDVIENAANQRMVHLRTFQTGRHSQLSQKLLNEVAAAKVCLLNPEKKAAYDNRLREQEGGAGPGRPPDIDDDVLIALEQLAGKDQTAGLHRRVVSGTRTRSMLWRWFAYGVVAAAAVIVSVAAWLGVFSNPTPPIPKEPQKSDGSAVKVAGTSPSPGVAAGTSAKQAETGSPGPADSTLPVDHSSDTAKVAAKVQSGSAGDGAPAEVENGLKAELYQDAGFQRLLSSRIEPKVDCPWPVGIADQPPLPNGFWVRRTGWLRVPEGGPWKLILWTDCGVQLWLDGELRIDDREGSSPRRHAVDLPAGGGLHELKIDSGETGIGGILSLRWSKGDGPETLIPSQALWAERAAALASPAAIAAADERFDLAGLTPSNGVAAEFFEGGAFNRKLAARIDRLLDWSWDFAAPAAGVPESNFSVRWSGFIKPPEPGRYRLVVWNEGGARLWVDEKLWIDDWHNQAPAGHEAEVDLDTRLHPLRLEYVDSGKLARIRLGWIRPGASGPETIPASALFYEAYQPPAEEKPAERLPVPPEADRQRFAKQVADAYHVGSLHEPEEKVRAAREMLDAAQHASEEPAARYALLRCAAELADKAGQIELVLTAADAASVWFEVDPLQVKAEWLTEFAGNAIKADVAESYLDVVKDLSEAAIAQDRLDLAVRVAEAAYRKCERLPEYRKRAYEHLKQVQALAEHWARVQAARKTLETDPENAAAHLEVGRWQAMIQGNWQAGLSHLAGCGVATFETLAEQEAAAPATPDGQLALADAWWDAAQSAAAEYKAALLLRAGHWYRRAQPTLTGLLQKKVETRLEGIAKVERPLGYAADGGDGARESFPGEVWMDLIPHVDVRTYRVGGRWVRDAHQLTSVAGPCSRILLPVAVNGSYEFEAEFTRKQGDGVVCLLLPVGSSMATLLLSDAHGEYHALECIGGQPGKANATVCRPGELVNGRKYRATVSVRLDGGEASIDVALDGNPLTRWQGDPALLAPERKWDMPLWNCPGLGAGNSPVVFHRARFRSKSGSAILKQDEVFRERFTRTAAFGGDEGAAFRDLAPGGSSLIGFRYVSGKDVVAGLQPIYDTPGKRTSGRWCGLEAPSNAPMILANEGYAVGGIVVPAGSRVRGMQVVFMRKQGDRLNPADSYASPWIGARGDGPRLTLGGDGTPVVGVHGTWRGYLYSIGLLLVDRPAEPGPRFQRLTEIEPFETSVGSGRFQVNLCDVSIWPMIPHRFVPESSALGSRGGPENRPPEEPEPVACDEFFHTHASARALLPIPEGAKEFSAIGYCTASRTVRFRVNVDGQMLFESAEAGIVPIRVPLPAGAETLELSVDPAGDPTLDNAFWCYPRLVFSDSR